MSLSRLTRPRPDSMVRVSVDGKAGRGRTPWTRSQVAGRCAAGLPTEPRAFKDREHGGTPPLFFFFLTEHHATMTTVYQSKLSCGQPAWMIRENQVVALPVGMVTLKMVSEDDGSRPRHDVTYGFRIYDGRHSFREWVEYDESECFATKEELLASL